MALETMYGAMPNSPQTTLAANISAVDTSMALADASVLPPAPNLCTIGTDENAEVVSYTTITGNVVSGLIRGSSGTTASVWPAGTVIARDYTSYDHDTFKANITTLDEGKANTSDLGTMAYVDDAPNDSASYLRYNNGWARTSNSFYAKTDINTIICLAFSTETAYAIGDYVIYSAKLYRFTTAHPAGAWNSSHVTQVQTMTEVQKKNLYFTNQSTSTTSTASSEFCRITDSKIDANTVVLECTFTVPSAITSDVSWESASGYISLKGICTSTNCKVNIVLGQKGN